MTNDERKDGERLTGDRKDRDRDRVNFGKTPQISERRGKNPQPMTARPVKPPKPPKDGGSGISMKEASTSDSGKRSATDSGTR